MSAVQLVRALGVEVALSGDKVKLRGLDRLDHDTATRAIEVAREHRDQLVRELSNQGEDIPRPSREACQAQGCSMWLSGGPDDRACSWRCIGSIVHDGVDPEAADMPRLADLAACRHGRLGGTGLDDWPEHPPEDVDFGAYEAAGSLLDLCRRHGLRVVVTNGTARVIFPPGAPAALRQYADALLAEGRTYILDMKNMVGEVPTEAMQ